MNTYVDFENAKLLKEKRFTSYNTLYSNIYYNQLGELKEVSYKAKLDDSEYEVPTIAEVIIWLYEKHGIWISVLKHNKNGKGVYFESFIGAMTFSGYNTPTEAYIEAINYCLTKLI